MTDRSEADILSRLLCAVQARSPSVTPAGTDGSGPAPPAVTHHRHDNDPQFSTAAHTDMLLLNLMRINGLTPKHSRHGECLYICLINISGVAITQMYEYNYS